MSCVLPPSSLPPSPTSLSASRPRPVRVLVWSDFLWPFFIFFFWTPLCMAGGFLFIVPAGWNRWTQAGTWGSYQETMTFCKVLAQVFLVWPQAAECVGTRPTAAPVYTDPPFPAKPPVSPTNGWSGAKGRENTNKWTECYIWMKCWMHITNANPLGFEMCNYQKKLSKPENHVCV